MPITSIFNAFESKTPGLTGYTIKIKLPDSGDAKPISIFFFGCQGTESISRQKQVAKMMNEIAARKGRSPVALIGLGDNFYHHGVHSAQDLRFAVEFHGVFANAALSWIKKIPSFFIVGNHDEDIYKAGHSTLLAKLRDALGLKRMLRKAEDQVNHTFSKRNQKSENSPYNYNPAEPEKKPSRKDPLTVENLPNWNMPGRYYSSQFEMNGEVNTEIFHIDSNTLVLEALIALDAVKTPGNYKNPPTAETNQYLWLKNALENSTASNKILVEHHPPQTFDQRHFKSDEKDYLIDAEIRMALAEFGINGNNYNELLATVLDKARTRTADDNTQVKTKLTLVAAAHSHHQAAYDSMLGPGIIAGGGGGGLKSHLRLDKESLD
ncbi:MAG: metallophosphoesterase, partial [Gammaproteobacteria bacterium]